MEKEEEEEEEEEEELEDWRASVTELKTLPSQRQLFAVCVCSFFSFRWSEAYQGIAHGQFLPSSSHPDMKHILIPGILKILPNRLSSVLDRKTL